MLQMPKIWTPQRYVEDAKYVANVVNVTQTIWKMNAETSNVQSAMRNTIPFQESMEFIRKRNNVHQAHKKYTFL